MGNHWAKPRVMAFLEAQDGFVHVGGIAHGAQVSPATVRKVLAELHTAGRLEIRRGRTAPVDGDGRRTGAPGYRLRRAGAATGDRFLTELLLASADAPLDESLAGLHRIAVRAGIFDQTCEATSIAEVCDMIADWCGEQRETVTHLRQLLATGQICDPCSERLAGTSGSGGASGWPIAGSTAAPPPPPDVRVHYHPRRSAAGGGSGG
jgi:Mn-dependent DtxR family transcriptional regulator